MNIQKIGTQVKIATNDKENGRFGTITNCHPQANGYAVYIEGDDDDKLFDETELRLVGGDAASDKQIDYIVALGGKAGMYTKEQASKTIDSLRACHYCVSPANKFGFFGERVCSQCS